MNTALTIAGCALLALVAASRLLFLARWPAGWAMYLPNVLLETLERKLAMSRWIIEAAMVAAACLLIGFGTCMAAPALGVLVAYLLLVGQNLLKERRIINAVHGAQESAGLRGGSGSGSAYPGPALHPALSLNLEGPFVRRLPAYDLGVLSSGAPVRITLLVGNHTRAPGQTPLRIAVQVPEGWRCEPAPECEFPPLGTGEVRRTEWSLTPADGAAAGVVHVRVSASRFDRSIEIRHAGARRWNPAEVASAAITRYPGARRAAFSLRGDMDLYDLASFQSIDGLEDAFGLSARYAVAQTMYLSTRLSLDQEASEEWAGHYGVSRGAKQIPDFVEWMKEKVELRHEAPYPVTSARPFVIELGNHGHLHYDTDASGAPGNNWKAGARPGEGAYPWQGADRSSFGDQLDNIHEAARWTERHFGYVPRSWAKPGRGNDRFTPAAVEASGCEVASGSDIGPRDNVLRQPPPHHPAGTRIVELTSRYPSDPRHVQHAAMLEFWINRGLRLGFPVVVLVHQHMRQFDGLVCARITEHLLEMVVNRFNGDFYIDTVYGVGRYWLDVLGSGSRAVHIEVTEAGVRLRNSGPRRLAGLPLDIRLRDGGTTTRLVDLMPGETVVVSH